MRAAPTAIGERIAELEIQGRPAGRIPSRSRVPSGIVARIQDFAATATRGAGTRIQNKIGQRNIRAHCQGERALPARLKRHRIGPIGPAVEARQDRSSLATAELRCATALTVRRSGIADPCSSRFALRLRFLEFALGHLLPAVGIDPCPLPVEPSQKSADCDNRKAQQYVCHIRRDPFILGVMTRYPNVSRAR